MRYADLGDFLLSERAVRILKEFGDGLVQATGQRQMGGPTKSYMYHEYLAQSLTVINAALNDMKSEAKKDLKGRRPSHSRS